MFWHRITISGGTTMQREGEALTHADRFNAIHRAWDMPEDAFLLQVWSPREIVLFFSPGAIHIGDGRFEAKGACPCDEPHPEDALFLAGTWSARTAWADAANQERALRRLRTARAQMFELTAA